MNNKVKRELEKIEIPDELHNRAKLGVEKAKMEMWEQKEKPSKGKKKWSPGKKIAYFGSAAMLIFALLIGSAFVSPTMAGVMAKVPFLNSIFESEPDGTGITAGTSIFEVLKKEGYKVSGVGFRVRNKTMTISIGGSKEYYNDVKDKVKSIARDILQSKNYDAYILQVKHYKPRRYEFSEKQKKRIEQYQKKSKNFEEAIMKELKQRNFGILSAHVRINIKEKFVPLEILATEKRVEEMKKIVKNIAKEQNLGDVSIKVYRMDPEKKKAEKRWLPVINTITEGLLAKEEFNVKGVGYSFYPSPLKLSITTSIKSSNPKAEELGTKIERTVRNFIESEEVENNVKDDPYRIVVLSKDKKKIN